MQMSVGSSQNVVDALRCRHQAFWQVWYNSVVDCMSNANKYPIIPYSAFRNGEENEKLIRNPHADPDQHQKLITSRWSPLPMPAVINVRSRTRQLSCLQNDRQNDHIISTALAEVVNIGQLNTTKIVNNKV